jgi:hypothetical protein
MDFNIINNNSPQEDYIYDNGIIEQSATFSIEEDHSNTNFLYHQDIFYDDSRTRVGILPRYANMDFSTVFGSTNIEDCSALKKDEKEKVEDFNNIDSSIKINFDEGDDIISEDNNKQPEKEKEINILTINRGRPSKKNPYKGKHTRKQADNGSKVIIKQCKKSTHNYLQKQIELSNINKNKKNKTKLHEPTINNYLNKGGKEKRELFENNMKLLYFSTIPKRVKDNIKKEKYKYSYNRDTLTEILKKEIEDESIEDKKLNNLFEAKFIIYLDAFLNDRKYIIINGINYNLTEEFVTIKDCFNEGDSVYTQNEKDDIKKYIYNIINGEMHFKNKRKK